MRRRPRELGFIQLPSAVKGYDDAAGVGSPARYIRSFQGSYEALPVPDWTALMNRVWTGWAQICDVSGR